MPTPKPSPTPADHAPATLSKPAADLWRRIKADYQITDSAGLSLLSAALASWDRAEAAAKAVTKDGMTVMTNNGPRAHPMLAVERDSRSTFLRCMKSLNLDIAPAHAGPGRPPTVHGVR